MPTEDVSAVSNCYGVTTNASLRLLVACNWGPVLMNLGYFPFGWKRLNAFANLAEAQVRLVLKAIELLDVQRGHEVLDVACGRGKSTFMIGEVQPEATRVLGMDLLPTNIEMARTAFGETGQRSYLVGDATELPFQDESFDRVISIEAAFHFPDRAQFIREAGRVLRPGGRLVVVDFVWRDLAARQQRDHELVRTVRKIWEWEDLSTLDEYARYAESAGMKLSIAQDWSSRVSRALQYLFEKIVWLSQRPWGRRLMTRYNPQLRGLNDRDWAELDRAAAAHRYTTQLSNYMAMVFIKRVES